MIMHNKPTICSFKIGLATTLLLFPFLFGWNTAMAGTVEGVVFSDQGVVADSQVFAYPDYQALVNKKDYVKSSPGEKRGQYKLDLPPGSYYLTENISIPGEGHAIRIEANDVTLDLKGGGNYTYEACEAGTGPGAETCSDPITVVF